MKILKLAKHYGLRIILAVAFLLPLVAGFTGPVAADDDDNGATGAVYTITNAATGNEVVVFRRSDNGSLSMMKTYPTDGLGSGAGLGSQGAVALSRNGRHCLNV